MALDVLKVRVSTPTEPIQPGRGFYQLEEDALYVQVGPFSKERRFFSYLESPHLRLDFDKEGRLIFIEVNVPRRRWQVVPRLQPPEIVEAADIRWLNFREDITTPNLLTTSKQTILCLSFTEADEVQSYYLAEQVILQVDRDQRVTKVWVTDIVDDLAGQEIGAFRKKIRGEPVPFS